MSGIAKETSGKIGVLDTEHGSASLYADIFEFDTAELTDFSIAAYIGAIKDFGDAGYSVLVIDSMSHAWEELLVEVEKIAKVKYAYNTFRAWAEGTPMQKKFIEAILSYPGHVIATIRSKTEYVLEMNSKGKQAPRKVGLAPIQRAGLEYEFTMVMDMSQEHIGLISKDRTSKFQDAMIEKPGADFGKELVTWLRSGADYKPPVDNTFDRAGAIQKIATKFNITPDDIANRIGKSLDVATRQEFLDLFAELTAETNKASAEVTTDY